MQQDRPTLRLTPTDDGIRSQWAMERADLHFHEYGFDDYDTEVITLEAAYEHRAAIKALDWETSHRKWTGDAWQLDFVALDTAVSHLLDRGYSVTIDVADLRIFLSDYDAPVLEAHLPDDPPPSETAGADDDKQTDLSAF